VSKSRTGLPDVHLSGTAQPVTGIVTGQVMIAAADRTRTPHDPQDQYQEHACDRYEELLGKAHGRVNFPLAAEISTGCISMCLQPL
jgi:hypothetical protein